METNEQMLMRLYKLAEEQSGIEVGSYVKVLREAKDNEYGWSNGWVKPDMNMLIGKVCKVIDKTGTGNMLEPIVRIDGYDPTFKFPFFVLELVEPSRMFKPFEKVLVRSALGHKWRPDLYRYCVEENDKFRHETISGTYIYCLPYEGNEHLNGTTELPK